MTDFEQIIKKLVGTPCIGFAAGSGTGSVIDLVFGKKIPRQKPIDNPFLSKVLRDNKGEYSLLIECVWRLETNKKVICGAWDDNSQNGPMLKGLQKIVDHNVDFIHLSKPGLDLQIGFDNGFVLRIFCDSTNSVDKNDNYYVYLNMEKKTYCVKYRSKVDVILW